MIKRLYIDWNTAVEWTPHLLCSTAGVLLGARVAEGSVLAPSPLWAQVAFAVAAVGLVPLCFLSGRARSAWQEPWEKGALLVFNAAFAALCGVTVALLGATVHFEATSKLLGVVGWENLLWLLGGVGGVLGLASYLAGCLSRNQSLVGA